MHPWAGRGALGDPGAPGRGGEEAEELEGLQRDRKAGLPLPPGPHSSLTHRRVRVPAAAGAAAEVALRAGSEAADPSDGCRCRPLRRRVSSRSPATPLPAAPPGPASGLTQPPGPRGQAGRALPDLCRRPPSPECAMGAPERRENPAPDGSDWELGRMAEGRRGSVKEETCHKGAPWTVSPAAHSRDSPGRPKGARLSGEGEELNWS